MFMAGSLEKTIVKICNEVLVFMAFFPTDFCFFFLSTKGQTLWLADCVTDETIVRNHSANLEKLKTN